MLRKLTRSACFKSWSVRGTRSHWALRALNVTRSRWANITVSVCTTSTHKHATTGPTRNAQVERTPTSANCMGKQHTRQNVDKAPPVLLTHHCAPKFCALRRGASCTRTRVSKTLFPWDLDTTKLKGSILDASHTYVRSHG